MYSKTYADRAAGAVFLIGLGLLFTPLGGIVGGFWPGILFVCGASSMARGMAEGLPWYNISGGLWLFGLGLVFLFGFSLPLLLILIGLTMLFGYSFRSARPFNRLSDSDEGGFDEKSKTDDYVEEKHKHDEIV